MSAYPTLPDEINWNGHSKQISHTVPDQNRGSIYVLMNENVQ